MSRRPVLAVAALLALALAGCTSGSAPPGSGEAPPPTAAPEGPPRAQTSTPGPAPEGQQPQALAPAAGAAPTWSLPDCVSHGVLSRVPNAGLATLVPDGYRLEGQDTSFVVLAAYSCASAASPTDVLVRAPSFALLYTFIEPPDGEDARTAAYLLGVVSSDEAWTRELAAAGLEAATGTVLAETGPGSSRLEVSGPAFSFAGRGAGFVENHEGQLPDGTFAYYQGPLDTATVLRARVTYQSSSQLVHPVAGPASGTLEAVVGAPAFAGAMDEAHPSLEWSVGPRSMDGAST